MSPAGNAPALPSDLLHGLALRPPVAAWDGLRYRGSVPLQARLQDAPAMAGVVAAVRAFSGRGGRGACPCPAGRCQPGPCLG
jgi:nicotinate dehydrogenase subunit B